MIESLCRCGHLKSGHTPRGLCIHCCASEAAAPIGAAHALEVRLRELNGMLCEGYNEWSIDDIPFPATPRAIALGCTCSQADNARQVKSGRPPIYMPGCPIHVWVCQRAEPCEHEVGDAGFYGEIYTHRVDHHREHDTCEHCTVPRIECAGCGKVWMDWRVSATQSGWVEMASVHKSRSLGPSTLVAETMDMKTFWRCETCQQSATQQPV